MLAGPYHPPSHMIRFQDNDVIGITSAPDDSNWWTGRPYDKPADPSAYLVNREFVFRIPTQEEQPYLDSLGPNTPVLCYGEFYLRVLLKDESLAPRRAYCSFISKSVQWSKAS